MLTTLSSFAGIFSDSDCNIDKRSEEQVVKNCNCSSPFGKECQLEFDNQIYSSDNENSFEFMTFKFIITVKCKETAHPSCRSSVGLLASSYNKATNADECKDTDPYYKMYQDASTDCLQISSQY